MSARSLAALDRLVARGGDVDDLLRNVVALLAAEPGISWAGISFREDGELSLGPQAGRREEARRVRTPIVYDGAVVGELAVDGEADATLLAQVAMVVAPYTLLGWDTGGEVWEP
jgi:putative methionine-R-sulfoxide reductase with GAF domain